MKAEEGAKLHARCHFNIDYATLSFSAKSLAKLKKMPYSAIGVWLVKFL